MRLEGLAPDRLASIVEPFGSTGTGISVGIEDVDGRVVASGGIGATGEPVIEARRDVFLAGRVIGRVVGRGRGEPAIVEAIVESVAASVAALAEAALAQAGQMEAVDAASVRLDAELALGRQIQRSFVPLVLPEIPGYELAAHYDAAREVGGDFFDVFRVRGRDDRLAICIADVTGKGIAAALLMAFSRPLLHAAIDNASTPVLALERTNRILVEERRSSLFITALCAVVEVRRGVVRFANAGHEPPLIVPADGGPVAWLEGSGPLLGAFPDLALVERSVILAPGDLLLLYTDGVTDAQAASGERFGDERLVDVVQASRGGTASDVVEAVCDAYHRFQGEMLAADDVTIVAIRRSPRRG